MKIKVYVIEISARSKRNLVLWGALALVAAMALPADANVPNQFATGEVLSASQMNANFAYIDAWRGHPVVTRGGQQWSLGAVYCGSTAATNGQITGGYAGAKALCQTACASPSAHMCTGEELVRSVQVGVGGVQGWYASGVGGLNVNPGGYMETWGDCSGWTSSVSSNTNIIEAPSWNSLPGSSACNASVPVLCCD
jgi:hypothetical protein